MPDLQATPLQSIENMSDKVSRHGTAMNQRCSESNGLPKDEDTKLKKRKEKRFMGRRDVT